MTVEYGFLAPDRTGPAQAVAVFRVLYPEQGQGPRRGFRANGNTAGWEEDFNVVGRMDGSGGATSIEELPAKEALDLLKSFGHQPDEIDIAATA